MFSLAGSLTYLQRLAGIRGFKGGRQAAGDMLFKMAHQDFALPGNKDFVLGGLVSSPKDVAEEGKLPWVLT